MQHRYAIGPRIGILAEGLEAGQAPSGCGPDLRDWTSCRRWTLSNLRPRFEGHEDVALWSMQLSERMQVVGDDVDLALSAGLEKCRNNRLSLADSY